MDLLSFSPSLLPIISLLDRKEVALCRLVNRRFRKTIDSSRRISPRKSICLEIEGILKTPHEEYVLVNFSRTFNNIFNKSLVSISIDRESISILQCEDTKLFEYSYKEGIIDGLSIGSIVEGLWIVLQPLFLNHNFKSFNLINLISPENNLCSTVLDIYKRNHGYLDMFHKLFWPHLSNLLVRTGTIYTFVPSKKHERLPKNLSKEVILCSMTSVVGIIPAMVELFQGWYEGLYRIFRLKLYESSEITDVPSFYTQIAASFGSECKWKAFLRFETFFTISFGIEEHTTPLYEVFFRRPCDDVILCISYHNQKRSLYIYDYPHSGPLEEIKFCYDQYILSTD